MRILIAGQGLAGSLLGLYLSREGMDLTFADVRDESTSTQVAAGIVIPVTGRRLALSWKADKLIPFAVDAYTYFGKLTGSSFFFKKKMIQVFNSISHKNDWFARAGEEDIKPFVAGILSREQINTTIKNSYGGILLDQCGYLDTNKFLEASRSYFQEKHRYFDSIIEPEQIISSRDGVSWNNELYDYVIFCEGYKAIRNTFFSFLPFVPAKGEILDFTSELLQEEFIINSGIYILPLGNDKFRAGATYDWNELNNLPTTKARELLEKEIRNAINAPFTITSHKAGVRPSVKDRRPFLGFHPVEKRIGIFNGLGTKGVMLAPYYANQLSLFLINGTPIDQDVDIRRFAKIYQEISTAGSKEDENSKRKHKPDADQVC
jgi:glycine/D-amino acid oxidase-like deaminating enzyme